MLTARYELNLLVFNRFPPLKECCCYQKSKRETSANIPRAMLFQKSRSIGSRSTVVCVELCVSREALGIDQYRDVVLRMRVAQRSSRSLPTHSHTVSAAEGATALQTPRRGMVHSSATAAALLGITALVGGRTLYRY